MFYLCVRLLCSGTGMANAIDPAKKCVSHGRTSWVVAQRVNGIARELQRPPNSLQRLCSWRQVAGGLGPEIGPAIGPAPGKHPARSRWNAQPQMRCPQTSARDAPVRVASRPNLRASLGGALSSLLLSSLTQPTPPPAL